MPRSSAHARGLVRVLHGGKRRAARRPPIPGASRPPARYSYGWLRPSAWNTTPSSAAMAGCSISSCSAGRAGSPQNPRMPPLETALFESGQPVLIAPPAPPPGIGPQCSGRLERQHRAGPHQRLRAAAAARGRAGDGAVGRGRHDAGTDRRGGRAASAHERRAGHGRHRRAGHAHAPARPFSTTPAALGCDLLVKGAYTQSRLRQMIFGGATRHILANATLPVLMAH